MFCSFCCILGPRGGGGGSSGDTSGTITIRIPNPMVGSIIGRGGETIKRLQQLTGAKIQISKDESTTDREVTLVGGVAEVQRAKAEIDSLIHQKSMGQMAQLGPQGNVGGYGGYPDPNAYQGYGGGYQQQQQPYGGKKLELRN